MFISKDILLKYKYKNMNMNSMINKNINQAHAYFFVNNIIFFSASNDLFSSMLLCYAILSIFIFIFWFEFLKFAHPFS